MVTRFESRWWWEHHHSLGNAANAVQPSQSTLSLDDKIAQIAGNLSIRDSYAASQGCRIYRAPDGSLSAVNWSGTMPCVVQTSNNNNNSSNSSSNANNSTMSSGQQLSTPIHPSPSMNQINSSSFMGGGTSPGFTNNFVLNANNPWATAIVPQSLVSLTVFFIVCVLACLFPTLFCILWCMSIYI
ncbi:unnamed protein product [Trichobilharzia regenti]|nr:unnamed protein product [Trichobilharzia regenti]